MTTQDKFKIQTYIVDWEAIFKIKTFLPKSELFV